FDLEVDRINKPRRPLPSGRLSVRAAIAWYLVLSVVATTAATVLVPPHVGALVIAWQVALAFYARWCKRWLVVGNLVVAAISSSAFTLTSRLLKLGMFLGIAGIALGA